jgi:hypothetical protein
MIKKPIIIKNLLTSEELKIVHEQVFNAYQNKNHIWDDWAHRNTIGEYYMPILTQLRERLMPIAIDFFEDKDMLPSYSLYSEYTSQLSNLHKHKDFNACTYTIDLCLKQEKPWGLWIEDKEYILQENEAILFYGEDQLHWREDLTESNNVAMVFFHYAHKDHWYFTKGPDYVRVARNQISEEDWEKEMIERKK